jgi:two-component sensor histidine kinase
MLRRHRRVLIELAHYAAESDGLRPFMDQAVLRVSSALEIDHVKLLRYRPQQNDLFMEAGFGWSPGVVQTATFATDLASPVGRAFQTAQPVLIEDVSKAKGFRPSEVLRSHGIVALINVPILIGGAAWGVIEADSSRIRGFSEECLSFMKAVASLVSGAVRRMEAEAALDAAALKTAQEVRKRELLIREMQHRVKNNFQMLLGLVSLRARDLHDEEDRQLLDGISEAIMAMSLAHAQFSTGEAGEVLNLAGYLRALAAAFVANSDVVTIEARCDELEVSPEQGMPIGLIVNELITNSLKHAFDSDGGALRLELHASRHPGLATLIVADNGRGLPHDLHKGTGMKIVEALAEQIGAELSRSSAGRGTSFQLDFTPRSG